MPDPLPAPVITKTDQIMAAAGTLFLEHGYGATSMDAIARRAGVSKATLYAHFTNKDDLFAAIVATECARAVPALIDPELESLPVAEGLYRLGRDFLELLLSISALSVYRVVVAETPRFPELGRAFYRSGPERSLALVADYLERAHQKGDLEVADPREAAALLLGMIRGFPQLRCLLGVGEVPVPAAERNRHVQAAVTLFVQGCRPARLEMKIAKSCGSQTGP